jgi:Flp pilus assembly protein TadB
MSQVIHHARTEPRRQTRIDSSLEILDLGAGLGIILLPLLTTSLAGVILFLIAPVALVLLAAAIPVTIAGVLLAPPLLLARFVWQRAQSRHIASLPSVKPVMAKNV